MSTAIEEKISGKYTHYKGKIYDVYCSVLDSDDNKYILYQQCYGDKSFWIRPYDMFFDSVDFDGKTQKRFAANSSKLQTSDQKIKKIIALIENQNIQIRHTETEETVIITQVNESKKQVIVHLLDDKHTSGYLTEYEIFKRLGYITCRINGEIKYFKSPRKFVEHRELHIGNNNIDNLKDYINPCSIDLQIAETGFLRTRFKLVDPQSIEHVSSATDLWKPVKKYSSKYNAPAYFKIAPGATILTHTKERIRIPSDCAGKIEIKSTFARLSLSITFGDFCNPGYDGYFPLEIKNNGRHTIIIHENETMAQLMLIPLQGPILDEYSEKATCINNKGFDDGTPYSFWRERAIKALRKKRGTEDIVEFSQKILNQINASNTSDVNAYRNRFNNNFLPFCHKNINKAKHRNNDSNLPDTKKLITAYISKEKRLKTLWSIKWLSGAVTIISAVLPVVFELMQNAREPENPVTIISFWPWFVAAGVFLIATILIFVLCPKTFCTFENIDIEKEIIGSIN